MKICIDVRSALKQKTGIGYYTLNLVNSLAKIDKENRYYLYSKIRLFNHKKHPPKLPGRNFKHIIDRFGSSFNFALKKIDIFHTSSYVLPRLKASKLVVVVHDVIHKAYPKGHTQETIEKIDKDLANILKDVDRVIVISDTTRKDLLKFYDFPEDKVKLIYPGVNVDFSFESHIDPYRILKKYKIKNPFILFVGTLEPRRNIEGLIKAYKILKDNFNLIHQLVIVGMRGWLYNSIFNLTDKLGLRESIVFIGYIPREDLSCFYKLADVFVYPSFYEGFGMPILEAFSFGAPVVTSAVSATAEVSSDAALLVNPEKEEDIAEAIRKVITDKALRDNLIERGKKRLKDFSWEKSAERTLEVFKECVE